MKGRWDEEEIREAMRSSILQGAILDRSYVLMNMLSGVIACYGLLANSPAVVIGAMIVAMLLGPINGLALALVEGDRGLSLKALCCLLAGVAAVMATALFLGFIHREIPLTSEIMARTAPNLLDMMVALAGGAAGPCATVSPRLSVAFVGVAIATALVPPLSSAGILAARGEFELGLSAFVLAFTNMVAIPVAASSVLWLNGFRRSDGQEGLQLITFLRRNALSLLTLGALALIRVLSARMHETRRALAVESAVNPNKKKERRWPMMRALHQSPLLSNDAWCGIVISSAEGVGDDEDTVRKKPCSHRLCLPGSEEFLEKWIADQ